MRWRSLLPVLIVLLWSMATQAQIPFYTDDADTTAKGKFHIEMFNEHDVLQKANYPTKRQNTTVFTIDYGLTNKLEFGVNAPLITFINSHVIESGIVSGVGDVQFGLKYKLREEREDSRLPAFAAVFYVEAPTGSTERELGSGLTDYWVYGIAQKSISKTTKARVNGGVLFSGNSSTGLIGIRTDRGQVYTGNFSLVRDFSDKLTLGAEVFGGLTNNFNLDRGQLTGQMGGHYSVNQKLQLTFAILAGRFTASPRAGVHLGFAYDF